MSPIAVLLGVFKFWDQITWFLKLLQKTPEELHQQVQKKVQAAFDEVSNGGRPGELGE